MTEERRVSPMMVTLKGGVLDGDTFELLPQGSVLPPLRLSYAYRDRFPILSSDLGDPIIMDYEECGCWLHYECKDHIPEWSDAAVVYTYAGKERMKGDR